MDKAPSGEQVFVLRPACVQNIQAHGGETEGQSLGVTRSGPAGTGDLQPRHLERIRSPANSMSRKNSVELQRMTALRTQGHSNTGFQNEEDFSENQNTSGNDKSVSSRVVQNREHENSEQGEEQVAIEQDSPRKDGDEEDEQDTHQEGCLERKCGTVCDFCKKHKTTLQYIIWGILIPSYLALVIAACVLNFHRALPLFVITVVVIFFVVWDHFMAKYESRIDKFLSPGRRLLDSHWFWLKWVTWGSLTLAVLLWLILDTAKLGQRQLVSFGGLVMYTILTFLFSKHPTRTFLAYSDAGASFVFGEKYTDHFFAFKVLPIVVFFSTVMSMLYYLGLMQWLVRKVGWIMLVTMGTSPVESVVASGNIFVGQGASSSIALVANIAVNLIAFLALLSFVNSALSWFGNMFDYPQLSFESYPLLTRKIQVTSNDSVSTLTPNGQARDYEGISVPTGGTERIICSYIFMPFSFMMGVDWQDSFMVAKLIGYKTFFNEFVAYQHLSELIHLRQEAGPKFVNGVQQYMSIRSETVATYALCGFANIGSLGIVIGGLTSITPSRKRDIASGAVRALIAGTIACFMTACIAGMLTNSPVDSGCHHILEYAFNSSLAGDTTNVVSCCQSLLSRVSSNAGCPDNTVMLMSYSG
ncbi:hypothetical protein CB1_000657009 [Camelus ferus]|nr:hypothetical protein CB1_000657009 [Camelus ferus]